VEEQECFSCDAIFEVAHDNDEEYYKVKYCPFCGTQIEEESLDWNDWDEDE
jgi:rRNA maturation endonuclease Nob1